jgi:RNA polymerase sigma-70 factor (ECF subfamily)
VTSARHEAYEDAMAEHYPGLVRRLAAVVHDAEAGRDLAQEAYLQAYRAWERFDGRDPRAWLHTIGLRLAFNERRRRRRWTDLLQRNAGRASPVMPTKDLELEEALASLRREHRAVLFMSVVDGYTQREIATMLDVAPGTVASWLSRAKVAMRKALTDA